MPSKRAVLSDLTSQLGLRGPYSKRGEDWRANLVVKEMWDNLTDLCKIHHSKAMEAIPRCPTIRAAQGKLLREYGPRIWSGQSNRPWLLRPGEGAASAPCKKDLYWHESDDQEFIKDMFLNLVVQKILRYRKDHIRTSRAASDNPSDPSYNPRQFATGSLPTVTTSRKELRCFAAGLHDHLDASLLHQSVWLGDYDEETKAVNGASWNEVEQNYYESIIGGLVCSRIEPYAVNEAPNTAVLYLQCAACKATATQPVRRLKIESCQIDWGEDDTQVRMNTWIFKCRFDGKDVYACVKELPERDSRRLGFDAPLWAFWKLDGGYTSDLLLTTASEPATTPLLQSDVIHCTQGKGKRRLSDNPEDEQVDHHPSSFRKMTMRSRTARHMSTCNATNSSTNHQPARSLLSALHDTEQDDARLSPNSLYDTTPMPRNPHESALSSLQEGRQQGSVPIADPEPTTTTKSTSSVVTSVPPQAAQPSNEACDIEDDHSQRSEIVEAIQTPVRFRVWFRIQQAKGQKVIILDSSMSVRDAFTRIHHSLRRHVEGMDLVAINLRFLEEDDDFITIDQDDCDGWETMVELVQNSKKAELFGRAELQQVK